MNPEEMHMNNDQNQENVNVNHDEKVENSVNDGAKLSDDNQENTANGSSDMNQMLQDEKDKYLRLYSEFDNFRKRTAKDRIDWMQTASKDLIISLLPVVDDFERAIKAMEKTEANAQTREGIDLIYQKLMGVLQKSGLQAVQSVGEVFDVEKHEAITQFAAPTEDMKGKVIDEVEKGYMLHDKMIRFAKVVVGN